MCGVQLDDVEARGQGALGGSGEVADGAANVVTRHGGGRVVIGRERNGRRRERLPAAVSDLDAAAALPWGGHGGLASGVGQLNTGVSCQVRTNKANYAGERLGVSIAPDAEIVRTDAAFGRDGCGLGEHQAGASDRATAEVNEVPVVGQAIN